MCSDDERHRVVRVVRVAITAMVWAQRERADRTERAERVDRGGGGRESTDEAGVETKKGRESQVPRCRFVETFGF